MATRTKKAAPQADPTTNGRTTYDARPGDVVVIAGAPASGRVVFIADLALRSGVTDVPAYALVPGVPTLLPARLFRPGTDADRLLRRGEIGIAENKDNKTRGVLPEFVDLQDTARRAELRDGRPAPPPKRQRIDDLRGRYIPDSSFAEAVLMLIDEAGYSEIEAVAALERIYHEAFRMGAASERGWVTRAQELVEIHRAKEAGLA